MATPNSICSLLFLQGSKTVTRSASGSMAGMRPDLQRCPARSASDSALSSAGGCRSLGSLWSWTSPLPVLWHCCPGWPCIWCRLSVWTLRRETVWWGLDSYLSRNQACLLIESFGSNPTSCKTARYFLAPRWDWGQWVWPSRFAASWSWDGATSLSCRRRCSACCCYRLSQGLCQCHQVHHSRMFAASFDLWNFESWSRRCPLRCFWGRRGVFFAGLQIP